MIGTKLAHYEITGLLGTGGMGQVYQATDAKLKRKVAIKVLPETLAMDSERLARFQREAEVLASINHPNIAAIYGLEEAGGSKALIMELVDGPTLAERIAHGAIPLDEALPIARQIAEALEAAHAQGIIHRDLKPANVKVRSNGTVKVLDFGLAKALEPMGVMSEGQSRSPVITTPAMTHAGTILGTAAYMAPEQARGRPVDQRADIWAFGCVLFEMLTGQRAFAGSDEPEVLASVLAREPDWSRLPVTLALGLRTCLERCLRKDVRQRMQAIGDVRLALEGAFDTVSSEAGKSDAAAIVARPLWRRVLPFVAVAILAVFLTGLAAWSVRPAPAPRMVIRSAHMLPAGRTFRNEGTSILAITPDGRQFAYNGTGGLYLRTMDALEDRVIQGTEGNVTTPFFSPNGESLGFFDIASRQLKRIRLDGETALVLAPAAGLSGANWEANGTILYAQPDGIWQISENGGEPRHLIDIDAGEQAYGPRLLPNGDWVMFTLARRSGTDRWDEAEIVTESPATHERRVLRTRGRDARYLPTGHLVYTLDNSLYAAPFDVDQLAVTGDAVQMVPDVRTAFQGGGTGAAFYAVAASGTLIYVPGAIRSALRALVWVDGKGQKVSVPLPARDYAHPRVSPDGARAAVDIAEDGDTSIWVGDMTRGTLSRVTPKGASRYAPVWTPDGKQLIYTGMANGDWAFFRKSADGTGAEERLALVPGVDALQAGNWSPDGKQLVFEMTRPGKRGDIGVLSLQGQPSWMPLLETEANEFTPAISPDGRWVAYGSNETANPEIYVQRFPDLGDRQQVSTDGGLDPWWGPDGRKLSYIEPAAGLGGLMEVTITTGSTLSIGKPVSRFPFSYVRLFDQGHNHDIAPDGQRFLMVANQETTQSGANSGIPRVAVVVNWFDELRRFVRTN